MITLTTYLICTSAMIVGRALDLISTYLVTPDFQLELNQWMRKVGWSWTILINIVFCLTAPVLLRPDSCAFIAGFSALFAWRNLVLLPAARGLGVAAYQRMRQQYQERISNAAYFTSSALKAFTLSLLGFFLLAATIPQFDGKLWFIGGIGKGFIFSGVVFFYFDIMTRYRYLRSRTETQGSEALCKENPHPVSDAK